MMPPQTPILLPANSMNINSMANLATIGEVKIKSVRNARSIPHTPLCRWDDHCVKRGHSAHVDGGIGRRSAAVPAAATAAHAGRRLRGAAPLSAGNSPLERFLRLFLPQKGPLRHFWRELFILNHALWAIERKNHHIIPILI